MRAADDVDRDLRIAFGKLCDRLMQLHAAVTAQIADAQLQFAVRSQTFGFTDQLIHLFQYGFAAGVKVLPDRCQRKPPVFTMDELRAQFPFQRLDLLGNGGLRDTALRRRLGQAAALHDRSEIFHLPEQHTLPPLC